MLGRLLDLFKKEEQKLSLVELQQKHGFKTDKNTTHSYLPIYDELFSKFKNPSILEIGCGMGESLRLWRKYFPKSIIHGIDIVQPKFKNNPFKNDPKTQIFVADSNHWIPPIKYDIIIDDGSHVYRDQVTAYHRFFEKYCKSLYIIEDVQDTVALRNLISMNPSRVEDLREVKGQYDDILVVFEK